MKFAKYDFLIIKNHFDALHSIVKKTRFLFEDGAHIGVQPEADTCKEK